MWGLRYHDQDEDTFEDGDQLGDDRSELGSSADAGVWHRDQVLRTHRADHRGRRMHLFQLAQYGQVSTLSFPLASRELQAMPRSNWSRPSATLRRRAEQGTIVG